MRTDSVDVGQTWVQFGEFWSVVGFAQRWLDHSEVRPKVKTLQPLSWTKIRVPGSGAGEDAASWQAAGVRRGGAAGGPCTAEASGLWVRWAEG